MQSFSWTKLYFTKFKLFSRHSFKNVEVLLKTKFKSKAVTKKTTIRILNTHYFYSYKLYKFDFLQVFELLSIIKIYTTHLSFLATFFWWCAKENK